MMYETEPMLRAAAEQHSLERQAVEAVRNRLAIWGAAGLLAISGASEAFGATESQAATVPQAQQATLYRNTSLKLQTVLNKVHHRVIPIDQEATIKPTAAFMKPSTAGFRTDCHIHASYKY